MGVDRILLPAYPRPRLMLKCGALWNEIEQEMSFLSQPQDGCLQCDKEYRLNKASPYKALENLIKKLIVLREALLGQNCFRQL